MATKQNLELREHAKQKHVCLWELASAAGMHHTTLINHLRFELPEATKVEYMQLIDQIAAEREE